MQAMTIREAGVEGIYTALADGMKAAGYARELDAARAENELLKKKIEALRNEGAVKDEEINRLRRACRNYRFSRSRAYAGAIEAQVQSAATKRERVYWALAIAGLGAVVAFAIVFAVVWSVGI